MNDGTPVHPTGPDVSVAPPTFDVSTASNGDGACMGEDALASGVTTGMSAAGDLNCTANDIAIASATVTEYSLVSAAGPFTALTPGTTITCNQGSTIYARTSAILQNNAQKRWDIGVWIALDGGNANTGSCRHFNLVNGTTGVLNDDSDSCGDMAAGGTTTVPLDVLTLTCTPAPGSDSLLVGACLGWKNSIGTNGANVCPATPPGGSLGFRYGTVPETKAKCNCDGFKLPITVNQVAHLEVAKVCAPTNDAGTFDLLIDGSNAFGDNKSCGQSTGSQEVGAGTNAAPGAVHTFGEGDFTIANYTTTYSCVNRVGGASRGSGTSLGPNNITLQPNDDVICTYTNTRKPRLTVNKVCAPTNDGGHFNLQIDAATAGTGSDAACGGTTGTITSTIGAHTVGETAGTATSLSDYFTPVIGGDCASNGSITLAAGDNKTCTITNTRRPTLTVTKVCNPTTDGGHFNLQIDASTAGTGANAACGGTTGAVNASIGSHTVGETAGTSTSLTDYAAPVFGGDCASNGSVTLAAGDHKTCTITNTHKATLTVNKVCAPTTDGGHFNLQIDGSTAGTGTNAACGGTTGAVTVSATTHTVGETAGSGSSLTDYNAPVITGDCASNGSITLAPGDNKTCTITNTRKPKLTVTKICAPTNDGGHFNLQIDGSTAGTGTNAACGGTTGAVTSTIGSHSVGETAGTSTSLSDYFAPVYGGDCASDGSITLAAGDNKSCTITNTRKPKLTVTKVCVPTNDGGHFNLQIDAATAGTGANAACGGTTGAVASTIGSHTVGETAGSGSALTDYDTVIGGDCAANGSVTLAAGDNKTCTITNSRLPNLTVKKVVIGTGATFSFSGTGTGVDASFSISPASDNFATKVFSSIPIGTKTVTETLLAGYVLTDLTCDKGSTIYDPLVTQTVSTTLAYGDNVTCTFTNELHVGQTTRTQGFWATHSSITNVAWFGGDFGGNHFAGVDQTLCGKTLDTLPKVLGGFWSNIAQTTTKTKRSALDQARMRELQQLLAAELNGSAFGSVPSTITIAAAEAAYCGTDITAISDAASKLAAFNESGDSGAFTPGASANGKVAKDLANLGFWDLLP